MLAGVVVVRGSRVCRNARSAVCDGIGRVGDILMAVWVTCGCAPVQLAGVVVW